MADLKTTFTRKLGPLPVWSWALVGGTGVAVVVVGLRRARAAQAASLTTRTGGAGDDFAGAGGGFGGAAPGPTGEGWGPGFPIGPPVDDGDTPAKVAPPTPTPAPSTAVSLPSAPQPASPVPGWALGVVRAPVVGVRFRNAYELTGERWLPRIDVVGSVRAPAGSVLDSANLHNGVVERGVFVMPDGSRTVVRSSPASPALLQRQAAARATRAAHIADSATASAKGKVVAPRPPAGSSPVPGPPSGSWVRPVPTLTRVGRRS